MEGSGGHATASGDIITVSSTAPPVESDSLLEVRHRYPDIYHRHVQLEALVAHQEDKCNAQKAELLRSIHMGQALVSQMAALEERCGALAEERDATLRQVRLLSNELERARDAPPVVSADGVGTDLESQKHWLSPCPQSSEAERATLEADTETALRAAHKELRAAHSERDQALVCSGGRTRALAEPICDANERQLTDGGVSTQQGLQTVAPRGASLNGFASSPAELHTVALLAFQVHRQVEELLGAGAAGSSATSLASYNKEPPVGHHTVDSLLLELCRQLQDTLVLLGGLQCHIAELQKNAREQTEAVIEGQRARIHAAEVLETLRTERNSLKNELREVQVHITRRHTKLEDCQRKCVGLEEAAAASSRQARELELALERATADATTKVSSLSAEFGLELDARRRTQERLEKEVAHLRATIDAASASHATAAEGLHQRCHTLQQRVAQLEEEGHRLRRAHLMEVSRREQLEQELAECKRAREREVMQAEIAMRQSAEDARATATVLQSENETLKDRLADLHRSAQTAMDEQQQRAMEAERAHYAVTAELESVMRDTVPALQRELQGLQMASAAREEVRQASEATLAALRKELASHQEASDSLQKQLDNSTECKRALTKLVEDLQASLLVAKETARHTAERLDAAHAESQNLREKLQTVRVATTSLQSQVCSVTNAEVTQNSHLTSQLRSLQDEAQRREAWIARLEARCETLAANAAQHASDELMLRESLRLAEVAADAAKAHAKDATFQHQVEQRHRQAETAAMRKALLSQEEQLHQTTVEAQRLQLELRGAEVEGPLATKRVTEAEQALQTERHADGSSPQLVQLSEDMARLVQGHAALMAEKDRRCDALQERVTALKQTVSDQDHIVHEQQVSLVAAKAVLSGAHAAVASRDECIAALEEEVQRLQADLRANRAAADEHHGASVHADTVAATEHRAAMEANAQLRCTVGTPQSERDEAADHRQHLERLVMDPLSLLPLSARWWVDLTEALKAAHSSFRRAATPHSILSAQHPSSVPTSSRRSCSPPSPPEQVVTGSRSPSRDRSPLPAHQVVSATERSMHPTCEALGASIEAFIANLQAAAAGHAEAHRQQLQRLNLVIPHSYGTGHAQGLTTGNPPDPEGPSLLGGNTITGVAESARCLGQMLQEVQQAIASLQHSVAERVGEQSRAAVEVLQLQDTVAAGDHHCLTLKTLGEHRENCCALDLLEVKEETAAMVLRGVPTHDDRHIAAMSDEHKVEAARWVRHVPALRQQPAAATAKEDEVARQELHADHNQLEGEVRQLRERIAESDLALEMQEKMQAAERTELVALRHLDLSLENRLSEVEREHDPLRQQLQS